MHVRMRRLATAMLAVAASVSVPGPAAAAEAPVVVDGQKWSSAELRRWKGELHVAAATRGRAAVAFTRRRDFEAYVRRSAAARRGVARAAWHGDYVDLYSEHGLRGGFSFRINSGEVMPDLGRVCGSPWWCRNYNDAVSAVMTNAVGITLYSESNLNAGNPSIGRSLYVGPNQMYEIPSWFDNAASSAAVKWLRG